MIVAFFFAVVVASADPEEAVVLVELGLVEQRCQAVLEVINDGATVTDVARRLPSARRLPHRSPQGPAAGSSVGGAGRASRFV